MRKLIVTADDFGLCEAVNEAVERAHREGILTSASLMVGAPAAADAVRRAKALPLLAVGLHLVTIEGPAVLPPAEIPDLVDTAGWFPSDQLALGWRYAVRGPVRRQLAAEIRAQFAAFAATGLALDHANAHKHMHLHPVVGRLLLDIGAEFGLRAIRVPREPPRVLVAAGMQPTLGGHALYHYAGWLRRQAGRYGLLANDYVFGIAVSGAMTASVWRTLVPCLPPGLCEVYTHPASRPDPLFSRLMPRYRALEEAAALVDPSVAHAVRAAGATLTNFGAEFRV
jgi:hopanoid biosynthesis associated protein HpnK